VFSLSKKLNLNSCLVHVVIFVLILAKPISETAQQKLKSPTLQFICLNRGCSIYQKWEHLLCSKPA